jgi:hypothetical protein
MTDNSGVTNAPNITTNAVKKSPSSNTLDQPSQQSTLLVISGLARSSQMVEPQMVWISKYDYKRNKFDYF